MTDIKENTSGQGESMDRQSMIAKIYEVVGYNEYIFKSTDSDCGSFYTIMIGDVLDWQYKDKNQPSHPKLRSELVEIWGERRKPIEDQSDECIKYIYDLVSEK